MMEKENQSSNVLMNIRLGCHTAESGVHKSTGLSAGTLPKPRAALQAANETVDQRSSKTYSKKVLERESNKDGKLPLNILSCTLNCNASSSHTRQILNPISGFSKPTFPEATFSSQGPLGVSQTSTFTIYEDSDSNSDEEISQPSFSYPRESSPRTTCDSPQSSPMLLDNSLRLENGSHLDSKHLNHPEHEFATKTYFYLRELEVRLRPSSVYMRSQPDITYGMRTILVDWLVEVSEEYNLECETLYLSIAYMDRFLSSMSVLKSKLQLIGTASMFIASKYEEIYPPDLSELVYITDDTYTKKQVLRMEQLILNTLSFDLAYPTANFFVLRLAYLCDVSDQLKHLAQYLCELSLMEGETFLPFLPSEIASSAFALAHYTLGFEPWSQLMEEFSGYQENELSECVTLLHQIFLKAPEFKLKAIREKYKSPKYNSVSMLVPPPLTSNNF